MPKNSIILGERVKEEIMEYRSRWRTDWFTPIRLHILKKSQHELLATENRQYFIPDLPSLNLNEENYTTFINPYAIGIFHLAELIRKSSAEERQEEHCGQLLLNIHVDKIFDALNGWKNPDVRKALDGMTYMSENMHCGTIHAKLKKHGAIRVGTEFLVELPPSTDKSYDTSLEKRNTSGAPFLVARRRIYFAVNDANKCYAAQFLAIQHNLFTYSRFVPFSNGPRERSKSFTITARHFSDVNSIGMCFDRKRNQNERPLDTSVVKVLIFLSGESNEVDTKLSKLAAFLEREGDQKYSIEIKIGHRTLYTTFGALRYMNEVYYENLRRSRQKPGAYRCLSKRPIEINARTAVPDQFHFAVAPCHWLKANEDLVASSFTVPVRFPSGTEHIEIFSYDYKPTLIGFSNRVISFLKGSKEKTKSLSPMSSNRFLRESSATSSSIARSRSLTRNTLSPTQGKPPRDLSRSSQKSEPDFDAYIKTLLEPEQRVSELEPRRIGKSKSQSFPNSKESSPLIKKKSIKEMSSSSQNLAGARHVRFSEFREVNRFNQHSMPELDQLDREVGQIIIKHKMVSTEETVSVGKPTIERDPKLLDTPGESEKSKKSHRGSKKHKKSKKHKR